MIAGRDRWDGDNAFVIYAFEGDGYPGLETGKWYWMVATPDHHPIMAGGPIGPFDTEEEAYENAEEWEEEVG